MAKIILFSFLSKPTAGKKKKKKKVTTKGEISNELLSITDGKQTHAKIRKSAEVRTPQITLV